MTDFIERHHAPGSPASGSRAIGTAFQPSTTHAVFCSFTIEHVCVHGQDGTVELRSDVASTPTTVRASTRAALTDDAASMTVRQQISCIVPAGHYVKLVAGGTGTSAIVAQEEVVLP